MNFASPIFSILFLFIGLAFWYYKHQNNSLSFNFSEWEQLQSLVQKKDSIKINLPIYLRLAVLFFIVIALMQPQSIKIQKETFQNGIDIILALDTSMSMKAEDFKPNNRLQVAKSVIKEFIKKRKTDRIGLVVFGTDAYTQCPLTTDYNILYSFIDKITIGSAGDGTAIGMAIATALNRLKNSSAKSKIIILLTDGVSNSGEINPETATNLAQTLGIKVYTIGVGKEGGAPIPIDDPTIGRTYAKNPDGSLILPQIDEKTLKLIAVKTKAQYFRAKDKKELEKIYAQINTLEKTKIKSTKNYQYTSKYTIYLWLAFLLLLLEIIFSIIWIKIP